MSHADPSRYALRLKEIADQQACHISLWGARLLTVFQAASQPLNTDEIKVGRKLKRKRVAKYARGAGTTNPTAGQVSTTAPNPPGSSGLLQPGLASGLSQNTNGSERSGRKAQEEFVSQTIRSASNGASSSTTASGPPVVEEDKEEDTEMADQDDEGGSEGEGGSKDEGGSEDEEPIQGETPGETTHLERLKFLYTQQPNKTAQKALLAILEELARQADSEGKRRSKRHKGNTGQSSGWDQNDDYLCTDAPQQREKQRIALSGYIRVIIWQLLKLSGKKAILPPGPPLEVAAPTPAAFYIKWDESEKLEFNVTAARIVAIQIVQEYPSLCSLDETHDMVTCHFKYLCTRYRRQTLLNYIAKELDRRRACSARTWKQTLYDHRRQIINAVPALGRHGRLIKTLGLEGTSSDEEDPARPGIYIVKRHKQLSSQVQLLKQKLDQAWSIHFKGPGSKGNQSRKRVDTDLVSKQRLNVAGLPLSCMDPSWLAKLTDVQRDMHKFREMQYDFAFPKELLQSPEYM
ncbi:hypothetical protein FRC08_005047 [Ceratobasidium sp. 394]|nr:hypothetical protein FRC08_005047 [Ceratobasidium sp. 394]